MSDCPSFLLGSALWHTQKRSQFSPYAFFSSYFFLFFVSFSLSIIKFYIKINKVHVCHLICMYFNIYLLKMQFLHSKWWDKCHFDAWHPSNKIYIRIEVIPFAFENDNQSEWDRESIKEIAKCTSKNETNERKSIAGTLCVRIEYSPRSGSQQSNDE